MTASRIDLIRTVALVAMAFGSTTISVMAQQPTPWSQCCGTSTWSRPTGMMGRGPMMGGGMMGGGMMGASMPRHHYAMMHGIPAAYTSASNLLPRTRKTIDRGGFVYQQNCSACHGASGQGDGPASQNLSPRPANLALLAQMPMSQWDGYMFWSVSEGGSQFGTAMPAFKDTLSKDDRWAVIAYIQAHLPANK